MAPSSGPSASLRRLGRRGCGSGVLGQTTTPGSFPFSAPGCRANRLSHSALRATPSPCWQGSATRH
eukprot:15246490-Alexandrium_andersonii.AAC.1